MSSHLVRRGGRKQREIKQDAAGKKTKDTLAEMLSSNMGHAAPLAGLSCKPRATGRLLKAVSGRWDIMFHVTAKEDNGADRY